ncbi:MAG: tetratricopeptide repeat protein [Xanthomonadaceae bacterium]|nr:tetratricopeptide repeat protein [Xanthomonadaceae bacterium]
MNRVLLLTAVSALACAAPASAAPSGGTPGPSMPSGPSVNPQESFKEGLAALQAGDCKKAEKKFGEVLSVASKHAEANYYMGLAKTKCDKDKQAVKYFERAIKERENFIEAREQLALASIRLDDRAEAEAQRDAIEQIVAACTAETCDAPFIERANKAVERIEAALAPADAAPAEDAPAPEPPAEDEPLGDQPGGAAAAAAFEPLFLSDGDAGAARYREAVKLINRERFAEAIEDLRLAQAISGPHPDILNYLGFAHRKLGKFDEAKDYYAQALAIDPDHLGATEYLGELYLETGETKLAKKQLARLQKLCAFGCAEAEDLARLIATKASARAAASE